MRSAGNNQQYRRRQLAPAKEVVVITGIEQRTEIRTYRIRAGKQRKRLIKDFWNAGIDERNRQQNPDTRRKHLKELELNSAGMNPVECRFDSHDCVNEFK